jgi:CDP-glucose 4,6-dehydratase
LLRLFNGKRVLLTGDTGFKGSWLALWLNELGAEVLGLALPPHTAEDHFCVAGLKNLIRHMNVDIRNAAEISAVFAEFRPEFVFHLAAQPLVRLSYDEPKVTFDTNVGGSVNVLEAVRNTPSIRALVYITSDKCYKNKEWIWGYRENDELGGHDPYSASKAAAEIVFSSYLDSFFRDRAGFGAGSVRAGNVIGGGDWAVDRIVPDCIRALRQRRAILVRNPKATRPWQHVLDPLYGYLLVAARLYDDRRYSGAWNFGPETGAIRSVGDLVGRVIDAWGSGTLETPPQNKAPHEARLLHLNCDKAHQALDWHPLWPFDRSVQEAVFWYKEWSSGGSALELSRRQISKYMNERDAMMASTTMEPEVAGA